MSNVSDDVHDELVNADFSGPKNLCFKSKLFHLDALVAQFARS